MYVFFIRAFNDVDHIAPIVWRMAQDRHPVSVYCINPEYDIQSDYRLAHLIDNGVMVDYLYNQFDDQLGVGIGVLRSGMFRCYGLHRRFSKPSTHRLARIRPQIAKFFRTVAKHAYDLQKRFFYTDQWAQHFLSKSGARALCFDHIRPRQYIVRCLIKAANQRQVPTIALPHGIYIYTNHAVKADSSQEQRYDKFNRFDSIVTQNHLRKEVLANAGVDQKKIAVLGSARYCREWMAHNKKILPRRLSPAAADNKNLKLVFMTTRFAYRVEVERMRKTFDLLSQIDNIDVVVKPHTRTGKEASFYDDLPLQNADDISSVELCEWADAMIVIASSIIIEAMVLNKPVLYLKYLHANSTQYEESGACWTINSENDLEQAISSLKRDTTKVPYTSNQIDAFLHKIIYGDVNERDVLGDYQQHILTFTGPYR